MWQVTTCCVGAMVGIAGAQFVSFFASWLWLVGAIVLIAVCFWQSRRWVLLVMLVAGALLGLWRGSLGQQDTQLYQSLIDKRVQLTGKIAEDPETNRRGQLVLRIGNITTNGKSIAGQLWVTTNNRGGLQRSDIVTIDGKVSSGFGSFAASIQDATITQVSREQPGDIALAVRNDFASHIQQGIHDPAASLGLGYLLGQKRGLPDDLATALKIAGLTHIVVASGYNLTILVRLARRLFEKVSKFLSVFVGLLMIGGFVSITGLSPSMTRAGLVSALALWAWYYGRRFHPVTLLAIAGAVTALANPSYLWGDLGWSLSFAAFAGVMIVAPLIHAYFYGSDKPHTVAQILIETVSAQLMTIPIILIAFGTISNVSPLANLLIVPFVPVAMLLIFVAGIGAYILPQCATIIAWPAQQLLDAMIAVVHWCANLDWAQSSVQFPWWGALGWYALVGIVCVYLWRITKYQFHRSSIIE